MLVFRIALLVGAFACVAVAGASWRAGYPPELALTRGVFAFVAMCVLGFLGQLTVARAVDGEPVPPSAPNPPSASPPDPEPSV